MSEFCVVAEAVAAAAGQEFGPAYFEIFLVDENAGEEISVVAKVLVVIVQKEACEIEN